MQLLMTVRAERANQIRKLRELLNARKKGTLKEIRENDQRFDARKSIVSRHFREGAR